MINKKLLLFFSFSLFFYCIFFILFGSLTESDNYSKYQNLFLWQKLKKHVKENYYCKLNNRYLRLIKYIAIPIFFLIIIIVIVYLINKTFSTSNNNVSLESKCDLLEHRSHQEKQDNYTQKISLLRKHLYALALQKYQERYYFEDKIFQEGILPLTKRPAKEINDFLDKKVKELEQLRENTGAKFFLIKNIKKIYPKLEELEYYLAACELQERLLYANSSIFTFQYNLCHQRKIEHYKQIQNKINFFFSKFTNCIKEHFDYYENENELLENDFLKNCLAKINRYFYVRLTPNVNKELQKSMLIIMKKNYGENNVIENIKNGSLLLRKFDDLLNSYLLEKKEAILKYITYFPDGRFLYADLVDENKTEKEIYNLINNDDGDDSDGDDDIGFLKQNAYESKIYDFLRIPSQKPPEKDDNLLPVDIYELQNIWKKIYDFIQRNFFLYIMQLSQKKLKKNNNSKILLLELYNQKNYIRAVFEDDNDEYYSEKLIKILEDIRINFINTLSKKKETNFLKPLVDPDFFKDDKDKDKDKDNFIKIIIPNEEGQPEELLFNTKYFKYYKKEDPDSIEKYEMIIELANEKIEHILKNKTNRI